MDRGRLFGYVFSSSYTGLFYGNEIASEISVLWGAKVMIFIVGMLLKKLLTELWLGIQAINLPLWPSSFIK